MSADHDALEIERQLAALVHRFQSARRPAGRGRVVMFAAARRASPCGEIARGFARLVAGASPRPVWLVDLDLANNGQFKALSAPDLRALYGDVGQAYDAALGETPFWSVRAPGGASLSAEGAFLTLHQVGGSRLFVSRFHGESVPAHGAVRLRPAEGYWRAARRTAELVVLDTPAREISASGVALAPEADGVVLVMEDDARGQAEASALKDEIERAGGRCEGVVVVQRV